MSKTVRTMDKASARRYDGNGWFEVDKNPISKVGVFPYLGETLGLEGDDAEKIFMVYRPAEELADPECIESFKLQPWIDDHTFLGSEDGATPADEVGVHGVIGERVFFEEEANGGGTLYGNLKCFSDKHAKTVNDGKRELSLGYRCEYDFTPGTYNGENYHAVQRRIRGNHVASVDEGRMGKEVAVMDASLKITCDHKDFKPMSKAKKRVKIGGVTMDAAALRKGAAGFQRLTAARKTGDADEIAAAVEAIEKIAPLQDVLAALADGGEVSAEIIPDEAVDPTAPPASDEEEEEEVIEKKTEDEDPEKKTGDEDPEKKTGDEDPDADKAKKTGDQSVRAPRAMDMAAVLSHINARDDLAAGLSAVVGTFDHKAMTLQQVADYGVRKLGLKGVATGDSLATVRGVIAGHARGSKKTVVVGDSAVKPTSADPFAAAAKPQ